MARRQDVRTLYEQIIETTCSSVKTDFVNAGVDESVLHQMRTKWKQALENSGVLDETGEEPEIPQVKKEEGAAEPGAPAAAQAEKPAVKADPDAAKPAQPVAGTKRPREDAKPKDDVSEEDSLGDLGGDDDDGEAKGDEAKSAAPEAAKAAAKPESPPPDTGPSADVVQMMQRTANEAERLRKAEQEAALHLDERPLSSDDDDDDEQWVNIENTMHCYAKTLKKPKGKAKDFKVEFIKGVMRLDGKDYVFKQCGGSLKFYDN
ncbi:unnamed protein product [Pedinophyceae sp. YPF-701]|nr:unnamed protein product [Pedinophyceae sp. YPF-701]